MSLKEIKDLIQIMNDHNLVEIEIEREGFKVRLVKKGHGKIEQQVIDSADASLKPPRTEASSGETPALQESQNTVAIKAPMVGTFYATPSPEADSYVQEGSLVEEGQVVCIIEAMKLMNEIKSEVKGKVAEILVKSGQPVEFGQPLFLIEKSEV